MKSGESGQISGETALLSRFHKCDSDVAVRGNGQMIALGGIRCRACPIALPPSSVPQKRGASPRHFMLKSSWRIGRVLPFCDGINIIGDPVEPTW